MMRMIKVEILSSQSIAPSSPTPDHLKRLTLSKFDQLAAPLYIPLILFYTNTGDITVQEASDRLKKSLSLTLTSFFPFAAVGSNIRNNTSVDCNDEGVLYTDARVSCNLRDFVAPPDMDALLHLLPTPCGLSVETEGSGRFLLIQQSVFECGGIALGICFYHKMADAATVSCFLKSWAAASASGRDASPPPHFNLASLFPPLDSSSIAPTSPPPEETPKRTFTRFVFSPSKVSALKAKSCSTGVSNPTRIEVVSSLIWKCVMRASSASKSNIESSKSSHALRLIVNLRKRVNPPLADNSFGNFVGAYISRVDNADPKNNFASLVAKMRDAKDTYMQGYPTKLRSPEGLSLICANVEQGDNVLTMTSWCKFGLYEADFGWGKPIWTGICKLKEQVKNILVLLDARDGEGIEAWLDLPEDVAVMFEQDQEFLSFASLNPSVLSTD